MEVALILDQKVIVIENAVGVPPHYCHLYLHGGHSSAILFTSLLFGRLFQREFFR